MPLKKRDTELYIPTHTLTLTFMAGRCMCTYVMVFRGTGERQRMNLVLRYERCLFACGERISFSLS